MAYRGQVIDVPFVSLDESPPDHGGPSGRLTSVRNAQVKHYTPAGPGVVEKVMVEPREGFVVMPSELRDVATGAVDATSGWGNPELLEALGDQLLAICSSKPRVFNGTTWTSYPNVRVVTNKLTQDVLHTTNHVLQAPDSARIGTVRCFAWTETQPNIAGTQYQPTVAFIADDGSWVRTPFNLFQNAPGLPTTLVRVVSDGTFFWVFAPIPIASKIGIWVYDTHGVQVASDTATVNLVWANAPGYWDIVATTNAGVPYVALAQPAAFSTTGLEDNVKFHKMTVSGAVITITATIEATIHCFGPVAFLPNGGTGAPNTFPYLATAAPPITAGTHIYAYELSHALVNTHQFDVVEIPLYPAGSGSRRNIPDSITGWVYSDVSGVSVGVSFSSLSDFVPNDGGPPNDPGLRYTRSYTVTRAGVSTLVNQVNGVLQSSRAFKIDQDWYSAVYYQSGGGQVRTSAPTLFPFTFDDATDYFIGDAVQPLHVRYFDLTIGSPQRIVANAVFDFATANAATRMAVVPSQAIATITHNAGDGAVAATQTWTLLNAAFSNVGTIGGLSAFNSYLRVTGSGHAANNADFRVVKVVSATVVVTEAVSTTGTTMVDDTMVGVTASLVATTTIAVTTEQIGDAVPFGAENYFLGTVAVTGAANPANNATYTTRRVVAHGVFPNWPGTPILCAMFICTPVGTNTYDSMYPGPGSILFTPTNVNRWGIGATVYDQDIGQFLVVTGTPQNDGIHKVTAIGSMTGTPLGFYYALVTGGDVSTVPQVLLPPLPSLSVVLADPSRAFQMHVASASFDASWKGAFISIFDSTGINADAEGNYQVVTVLSPTDLQLAPVDGKTGQRNASISIDAHTSISVTKTNNVPSAIQPCWYLMPLSVAQRVAGRWEWGTAFADWRFDGEVRANEASLVRNGFPMALSSVVPSADGQVLVLPFRAQSFTAGQVQTGTQTQTGLSLTAQSTVGLKSFNISAQHGQPFAEAGAMLLPGMQATQFSASGFLEDGINLGFEEPFLVGTGVSGLALALTRGATYQYLAVVEGVDEAGDRWWSTVSQVLEVTLAGLNDRITIGGRLPGPTNRLVSVCIYRVATIAGTSTVRHFKITNDLDQNGAGFTFSSKNGGAQLDSWQYVDTVPDAQITSSEAVYTDKGLLQRFPAPACSQGISGWKGRDWVVGYDGAVWMSGEKVEGDAVWWHPAFRFTAFGDDRPVSVCPMDDFLIVHCKRTVWYIPATTFPDATGRNGTLPNPVKLPFTNGGTGFAKEIRAGVAYSSTDRGVWLITRDLQNVWLSEPVRDSLVTVAGMTIDGQQRLHVITGGNTIFVYDQNTKAWWEWGVPSVANRALLAATFGGQLVFVDDQGDQPILYTPGVFVDNVFGTVGIAMDLTFSSLTFSAVRAFKCLWAMQIVGEYRGPHRLNAVMSYPDDDMGATTFGPFTPTGLGPYIFEINPMVEETGAFGIRIFTDFVGVGSPGQSCALEFLSCEVGLEPGLARLPPGRRIKGA